MRTGRRFSHAGSGGLDRSPEGLRKDKSPEIGLRTLLIHLGCGHSRTVYGLGKRAWRDLSDVALLKRLRKSRRMALRPLRGTVPGAWGRGFQERRLPSAGVRCDDRARARPDRVGVAPSLQRQPAFARLRFLQADRDAGARHRRVVQAVPDPAGRLRAGRPRLLDCGRDSARRGWRRVRDGAREHRNAAAGNRGWSGVRPARSRGNAAATGAGRPLEGPHRGPGGPPVAGRICAVRKTDEAIEVAHAKIRRTAQRKGKQVRPETLRFARFVIVFTTYPEEEFPVSDVGPPALASNGLSWHSRACRMGKRGLVSAGGAAGHPPCTGRRTDSQPLSSPQVTSQGVFPKTHGRGMERNLGVPGRTSTEKVQSR